MEQNQPELMADKISSKTTGMFLLEIIAKMIFKMEEGDQ